LLGPVERGDQRREISQGGWKRMKGKKFFA